MYNTEAQLTQMSLSTKQLSVGQLRVTSLNLLQNLHGEIFHPHTPDHMDSYWNDWTLLVKNSEKFKILISHLFIHSLFVTY